VSELEGDFEDKTWNSNIVKSFRGANFFGENHHYIRGFSTNDYTGVVNYLGDGTSTSDFGAVYVSWTEDESWHTHDESATVVDEIFFSAKVD
jgi:hypothetical protein